MAADPMHVRAFKAESDRHHDNARRALEAAKRNIDELLADWNKGPSPLMARNARGLAVNGAELSAEVGAYLALHDVRFMVVDDDMEALP